MCHVATLITVIIEEVDDKGACRISEQLPPFLITGVPSCHHLALVAFLVSLHGVAVRDNRTATDEASWAKEERGCSTVTGNPYNRIEHK